MLRLTRRKRFARAHQAMAAGLALFAVALLCDGARADDSAPTSATNSAPASAPDSAPTSAPDSAPAAAPDDGITKNIAKKVGLATDPGQPQDFVVKARPAGAQEYIPVGRKGFVREIKVKTPEELKAIEADLEAVRARHDTLRSTFAPAMKAIADAAAAKAAKADKSKKPPPPPASPQ
ncbi:MAG: hypothetical protein ABSE69_12500 [Roseiarcus sp.]